MKYITTLILSLGLVWSLSAQHTASVTGHLKSKQQLVVLQQRPLSGWLDMSPPTHRGGVACVDSALINPDALCPLIYSPVCGCDGVTYSNTCFAVNQGGVTSWTAGECGATPCFNPDQINLTVMCPAIYAPVCGCDGITYGNECEAYYYGGVTSWTPGECGATECMAYFYFTQQTGLTYYFNNLSSGNYTALQYDFGDGTTSTEPDPVHTFPAYGTYDVCITIEGPDCYSTYCETIVTEPMCLPSFVSSSNCLNTSVLFENYSLADAASYTWNFGDGSPQIVNNDMTLFHDYPAVGIYNTCLYIDGPECIAYTCDTVYVYNENTLPGYDQTFTPSSLPVTVSFQSGTLLPFPFFYSWDFGDGNFDYGPVVTHTFTTTCSPTVCLTVDAAMCSKQTCKTLDLCTTGIVKLTDHAVSVFPNPFTDMIQLRLPSANETAIIELLDVTGKLIMHITNNGQQQLTLDTQTLSKGIYLLKVKVGDNISHHKLVK